MYANGNLTGKGIQPQKGRCKTNQKGKKVCAVTKHRNSRVSLHTKVANKTLLLYKGHKYGYLTSGEQLTHRITIGMAFEVPIITKEGWV